MIDHTMKKSVALILTAYPIDVPRHGGQLRSAAIFDALQSSNWQVHSIAIFNPLYFPESNAPSSIYIDDAKERQIVEAGGRPDLDLCELIECDDAKRKKLVDAVYERKPDVILLEQPWLWPFVRRHLSAISAQIIYSSQNVESDLLRCQAGVTQNIRNRRNFAKCFAIEGDLTSNCAGLVAVSHADATRLKCNDKPVLIAGNGISGRRTFAVTNSGDMPTQRYALFISSAHPPNAEGFFQLLGKSAEDLGPDEAIFVIGGICDILRSHKDFATWSLRAQARLHLVGVVDQHQIDSLIAKARVILLPITSGGGSNLKTAEALYSRRPVIGTTMSFRGFETYKSLPNVEIADTPVTFQLRLKNALSKTSEVTQLNETQKQALDYLTWANALLSLPRFLTELYKDQARPALESLLTFGWYQAEPDGVWSSERIAGLRLPRSFLQGGNAITISMACFNPDSAKCDVLVFSRFRKVSALVLGDDKVIQTTIEFRNDELEPEIVEIFFRNGELRSPSQNGGSDVRHLGVRIINVVPGRHTDSGNEVTDVKVSKAADNGRARRRLGKKSRDWRDVND